MDTATVVGKLTATDPDVQASHAFTLVPGITYVIVQRPDLSPGTWTVVPESDITTIGLTTARTIALDPTPATRGLYRVHVPNCQVPSP